MDKKVFPLVSLFAHALLALGFIVLVLDSHYFKGTFLKGMAVTAAIVISSCWILFDRWLFKHGTPLQSRRIVWSAYLSVIFFFLPFSRLCAPGSWSKLWLDCLVYSGAVIFIAFAGASRIGPLLQKSRFKFYRAFPAFFYISCGIYMLVVGIQAISYYNAYSTEWVDFSFGFPPVWQTLHYGFFRMINEFSMEMTLLRTHWSLIFLVLSPITLVWKSPTSVLWTQTFFFTGSAYAVYLLANHYLKNRSMSYLIGMLFLAYLPVHLANLYDFHSDPLAMPFIFLSFLFASKGTWARYWICVAISLCCIEYVGLAIAGFGVWLCFKNIKNGLATVGIGLLWFFFVIKLGAPLCNNGLQPTVITLNYGDIGGSRGLWSIGSFCLTHPSLALVKFFRQNNIVAMMSLLLPFLFFPLRKPWILAAGVLIIIKNALSGSGLELLSHRETLFVPFIVYAFILYIAGLSDASSKRHSLIAATIAVGVTFFLQGHAFPARGFWNLRNQYVKSLHDQKCDRILKKIPDTAAVMSSSHIAPHLMTRKWYFLFPRFPTPVAPEFIVVDTLEQAGWDWLPRDEHQKGFGNIRASKDYELIDHDDGIFLFKMRR
jgi:uncharacterized membrane protein